MLLVTGITGHSGRYFLQELIKNKYEGKIRCIVRKSSDTSLIDGSGLNIEKVVGDLNNQEFLNEFMVGVDTVDAYIQYPPLSILYKLLLKIM